MGDGTDISSIINDNTRASAAYASGLPEEKPYDAKSHRALENHPKFASDEVKGPLGLGRRDDADTDWGPLGVSAGGFGYSAGRR